MIPRTLGHLCALLCAALTLAALPACAKKAADRGSVAKALPNGRLISEDLIVGGQPDEATLNLAKITGIRTVINLRAPGETDFDEAKAVQSRGMRYVHIPVAGPAGLTPEAVKRFDAALKDAGPVLAHCASGNRVGALFALRAHQLQGMDPKKALALGEARGLTSLKAKVKALLGIED